MTPTQADAVLAVLDDAGVAARLLETSAVLAQLMHRDLQIVYVESAAALAAAMLPATRVLARTLQDWTPLAPADVERGWQADTRRLRSLAARSSGPRAVSWSLRVTRGALHEAARALQAQTDLLLVAEAPAAPWMVPGSPHRQRVLAFDDGSAAGTQALRVAAPLAAALARPWQALSMQAGDAPWWRVAADDLVVMPAAQFGRATRAGLRAAALLVGTPA
jgi:hypothetical protein